MKALSIAIFILVSTFMSAQVICIDPGHGYGPNGENTDGRTWQEITTNCAVGLLLNDTLTQLGYLVIMTRTDSDTGSWMSLTQRAELADNYDSDRLLSIHCNAGGGTGTESFWCYRGSLNKAVDSIFSQIVQDNMVYYGDWRYRRSTEDELYLGFHLGVLKGATPGCLNEIGFVDTPLDSLKLLDEAWRKQFAIAYLYAINESFEVDYPSKISETVTGFYLFPNPATDKLILQSGISGGEKLTLRLIDVTGRILISEDSFVTGTPLDISALPPGYYTLQLIYRQNKYTYPVLKIGE